VTDNTDVSNRVLSTLRQITRAIDIRSRQLSKTIGLTAPQLIVLNALSSTNHIPIGRLADQVSLSQATVTSIVDRLESRHLITRLRNDPDRRKVILEVTDEGRRVVAQSPAILQEEFLDAFGKLPPEEQRQILTTLQHVCEMMKVHTGEDIPILDLPPAEGNEP
jgi:DNA-binding MarR family transcriptional regulator